MKLFASMTLSSKSQKIRKKNEGKVLKNSTIRSFPIFKIV